MRYIIDSKGCIKELSFGAIITCGGTECTEYTGSIPTGYESLESWYLVECETLYRWKIVDGNLTLDETAEAPVEKVIVRMNGKEEAYFEAMRADSTGCHHIEPYYSSNGDSGFIVYNDGVAYILTMASTGLHLRYYDQSSGQFIDYTLDGSGGSGGGGTGEAGVGILSVEQTTTSTADGGNNVITVTLTDGTKSTFTVKNGSKGSDGVDGKDGSDGVGIASMEAFQLTDADAVVTIELTDGTSHEFSLSAPQGPIGETGPAGAAGKSAFAYAQDGGYTGTEAEFGAKLAADATDFTFAVMGNPTDGYVSSATYTQIRSEMGVGRIPICSYTGEMFTGILLPLLMVESDHLIFVASPIPGVSVFVAIYSGDEIEGSEFMGSLTINNVQWYMDEEIDFTDTIDGMITAKIPAALKNPTALTINGTAYDGSSALSLSLAKKENGFFYIEGTGSTAGTWLGAHSDITAYYPGLTVLYKVPIAGASPTTLNINGLGAVTVVRNATTAISTTCPVDSVVMLTYTVDSGTAYWKRADYDVNTKTTTGTSNKTGTKLFLTGATSQTSSGTTTYSNSNVYIGTNNRLYSGGAVVPNVDEINALIQTQLGVIENGTY